MKVPGVIDAKPDLATKSAWVTYDPKKATPQKMVDVINKKTNFKASLPKS